MINGYLLLALSGAIIAGFSQILLKKGAMRPHISFIRDYLNWHVITGYAMMFLALMCSMFAYRGINYMSVQIVEAVGYIFVPVLSYFFFREKFTKNKILGIIIIVTGMIIYAI